MISKRVSIYNVDKEGREYDLAPDDQARTGGKIVQAWKLQDYRSMEIFLRCRYHETAVVLNTEAPRPHPMHLHIRFRQERQLHRQIRFGLPPIGR